MTPDAVMYLIVSTMASVVLVLLVVAVVQRRRPPVHKGPWIAALVIEGLPAIFLTIPAVVVMFVGEGNWITIGVIGLWLLIALTVMRPRWAAWGLIGSAAALPILLWLGEFLLEAGPPMQIGILQGLISYSARSVIAGGLLLWAAGITGHHVTANPVVANADH